MAPMFVALLMVSTVAPAQQVAPTASAPDIVVTGTPLADSRKALDACLARQCPPLQDMAATITHTENLFVAGRYDEAQGTVAAGMRRNRGYAREYPREVASLFRAHSRLSAHLGEVELQRSSATDMIDMLRSGLGDRNADVWIGRLELADVYAKQGAREIAEANYRDIANEARAAGNRQIEGYARFRRGVVLLSVAVHDPVFAIRGKSILQQLADERAPELASFSNAARTVIAQHDLRKTDDARAIGQLVATATGGIPTTRPALIYGEPVILNPLPVPRQSASVTARMSGDIVEDQWIDISFMIDANGLPQDIETLRTSNGYQGDWADAVVKSIQSRRYAPLVLANGQPGLFRVERYTKTAALVSNAGSRMRQRSNIARVEMTDLSVEPTAPVGLGTAVPGNNPAA